MEEIVKKKQKKWWQHLLAIPIVLIVDVIVFVISLYIDGKIFSSSDTLGHGTPFISIIALALIVVGTIVVLIISIVKAIKSAKRNNENQDDVNVTKVYKKPGVRSFIPLFVSLTVSIIFVIISFSVEIRNFYANPENIGFAFPIVSFIFVIILFVINIVMLIICLVINKTRRNKYREINNERH